MLPEGWASRAQGPEGITSAWVTGAQSLVSGAICPLLLGSGPQRHSSRLCHLPIFLAFRDKASSLPELWLLQANTAT